MIESGFQHGASLGRVRHRAPYDGRVVSKLANVALAVVAVGGAVWAVGRTLDARHCEQAGHRLVSAALRSTPDPDAVRSVLDYCRDPGAIAAASAALARTDPQAASRLAARALADAPDTFAAWAAVAMSSSDPAEAHAAWKRAKSLNPRWSVNDPAIRR